MERLLTIGVLAERCGLPRSALRFYDECGLLRPVAVDESSGYRYYESSQVAVAELIRRLRAVDMAVDGVRDYLAADSGTRRQLLEAHVTSVEERLVGFRTAAGELLGAHDREADDPPRSGCVVSGVVLAQAIGQVASAAATGGDRPELSGILVEARAGSLRLVATDSYRLAVRDLAPMEPFGAPMRALAPTATMMLLRNELATVERCSLDLDATGVLVADLDGRKVRIGRLDGDFPDYEQVLLGRPHGHRAHVGRLQLAEVCAPFDDSPVTLALAAGQLRVGSGQGETSVACSWEGPNLVVTVNGRFLADAVGAQVGPDIIVGAIDALQPVTFRSADSGTLSVWLMPIRTDP